MKILDFSAVRFRNLEAVKIEPCEDMNVICGENAQGKTNLVEGVWLFSGAKSFRGTKDSAFVKLGCEKAKTAVRFQTGGLTREAEMLFDTKRQVTVDGKAVGNPAKLAGIFHAVVFSPADLQLVSAGPESRRRFLDLSIGQLYPVYIGHLRDYSRAVTQRNALLKDLRYDGSVEILLDEFEREIAEKGTKIIGFRRKYLAQLQEFLPALYGGFSDKTEALQVEYACNCAEDLRAALQISRKNDAFSATTSVGPHRDDLHFSINGLSARAYGSQGQKRSVALAVKFAQAEVQNKIFGEYPICLLDDVMSELDPKRQAFILNHIRGWQTFLTCCDPSNIAGLQNGRVFTVSAGSVTG